MSLATWITLSRLLGIPFLLYGLHQPSDLSRWLSLSIFLVAASTDWLDGYLARKLNQVTDLGKFLDPLVDKLLVFAPLLSLIESGTVPAWGIFLMLLRELAIAGWRVNQPVISGANLWGKLKTVTQIIAIALLIAPLPELFRVPSLILFWLAVALTLISGAVYLWPQPVNTSPTPAPDNLSTQQPLQTLQEQLHQTNLAYHMAVEMGQFKAGFLSRTAHELRSPLNSILGTHQLILSNLCDDPVEEREFMNHAYQSTLQMLEMLDTVLQVARVEQGRTQPDIQPTSMSELLQEVAQLTTLLADDRSLKVDVLLPEPDFAILTDPTWLRQVLLHLVNSAILTLSSGTIRLSAQSSPTSQVAQIWVEDERPASAWAEPIHWLESDQQTDEVAPGPNQLSPGLTLLMDSFILQHLQSRLEIVPSKPDQCRVQCLVPLALS
jgi:CDP-diacylglycerol--glycerol-3-phosphate 3-phosphatidyltransferase